MGPGAGLAWLIAGLSAGLSAPAAAHDLRAPRSDFVDEILAGGQLEQRPVLLHGLPVRGAFETVLTTDAGTRIVAAQRPAHPPELRPREARVRVADLPGRVQSILDLATPPIFESEPELVYLTILGHPVLAWEVDLPLELQPEPTRKTLWLGASGGKLLDEWENVLSSRARVFLENPAITPEPVEVELSGLDVPGPGFALEGERVRALNCVTEDPGVEVEAWHDPGECFPIHRVTSDEDGNFFVPLPDIKYIDQNLEGEDFYAELSMYYHAERFFDVLESKGVPDFDCERATMTANFHYEDVAIKYPELPWGPLNNAYYTGQCDPEKGTTMLFGQGSAIDFAFDGDVVYHELGHGVVAHLTPDGLGQRALRHDGYLWDARGINEAMADYLSAMITGDPELADYVGRYWPSYSQAYIRTAENSRVCPDNMIGQEHNDGEPFMAALWATRKRVGEELDLVALSFLTRVKRDTTHEEASGLFLEIAGEFVDDGRLTMDDWDILWRSFEARGLLDCPRIITDPESVVGGRTIWVRRQVSSVVPFYPGPIQIRHEIPDGSDNFILTYSISQRGTSTGNPIEDPVAARVLVKNVDAAIELQYALVAYEGDGGVAETTLVSGDWDDEHLAGHLSEKKRQLVVRGYEPGDVIHLMLVNDSALADAVLSGVTVVSVPSEELDQGSTPGPGPGDDTPPPGANDPGESRGPATAGCACRTIAPPAPGALFVAGLLLAAGARRRRP